MHAFGPEQRRAALRSGKVQLVGIDRGLSGLQAGELLRRRCEPSFKRPKITEIVHAPFKLQTILLAG